MKQPDYSILVGITTLRRFVLITSFLVVFCLALCWSGAAKAQSPLAYQDRGGYYEGVRGVDVAGERLELIYAMIEPEKPIQVVPKRLNLAFYLDDTYNVAPVVYEKIPRSRYWLGDIDPPQNWTGGHWATFPWNTSVVIVPLRKVRNLEINDLVALVRLKRDNEQNNVVDGSQIERVAPALIYSGNSIPPVEWYTFGFKCNFDAHISYQVFDSKTNKPMTPSRELLQMPDSLFTATWQAKLAKAGRYELHITAWNTRYHVSKVVQFYHQPKI